jgi:hypothetical protein
MDNFINLIGLSDIVDSLPKKVKRKKIEQLYTNLHNDNLNSEVTLEIQNRV